MRKVLVGFLALALLVALPAFAAAPKAKMSPVAISVASIAQTEVTLNVTAGSTGAPAGFSIQWMTLADFTALGGWPLSDATTGLCKGSFSGNASLSRYNLLANETAQVKVGDFLFDNGASTNCSNELKCGTTYVLRGFAHANNTLYRSDFTPDFTCATLACPHEASCTYTQGYWKNHGPTGCASGNNTNQWPVTSLTLGTVSYTDVQLCQILQQSGGGLVALAHQLIAAKLNVANGADSTAVDAAIAAADAPVGGLVVPPVGSGFLAPSATSYYTGLLASYNEGAIGPGHID